MYLISHVYLHIFVIQMCNRVIIVHYCLHLLFVYRFHAEIAQLFWSERSPTIGSQSGAFSAVLNGNQSIIFST